MNIKENLKDPKFVCKFETQNMCDAIMIMQSGIGNIDTY